MASEAVSILISAEDKASAELAKTEAHLAKLDAVRKKEIETLTAERIAMEQGEEAAMAYRLQLQGLDEATAKLIARQKAEVAQLKEVAKNQDKAGPLKGTKAVAEFTGAFASFAGGSQLGGIASQIGGLTEKVSQFGEVAKAGGAAATLFSVGIAAAGVSIAFMATKAILDAIFETEKWNKATEKAIALSAELDSRLTKSQLMKIGREQKKLDLIEDPTERFDEYQKLIERTEKEVQGAAKEVQNLEKQLKAAKAEEEGNVLDFTGITFAEGLDTLPIQIEAAKKKQQEYFDELQRIREAQGQIAEDAKKADDQYLESLDKQLALLEAQQADGKAINETGKTRSQILQEEIKLLEARQYKMDSFAEQARQSAKTEEGIEAGTEKLVEIELLNKQLELEKELAAEKKKRLDDELASIQKLEQIERSQLDQIRLKTIEAEKGKQAREAEALVMQGLAESDAKRLAAQQAAADKRLEQQQAFAQGLDANRKARDQPLQAFMSRFMSRGPTEANKLEDLSKQQIKSLDQAVAYLRSIEVEAKKTKPTLKLGVDGI